VALMYRTLPPIVNFFKIGFSQLIASPIRF
jgi:hypothetical protein